MKIGDANVTVGFDWVRTQYPDGSEVHAVPEWTIADYARAEALGYGVGDEAVIMMTRDHDVLHSLLAEARGWAHSEALWGVAHYNETGRYAPKAITDDEERIVMLLHRVSRIGVNGILQADHAEAEPLHEGE